MKIRVTVDVDINFDLESDGVVHVENEVDSDRVTQAITEAVNEYIDAEDMVGRITDNSDWAVLGLTVSFPAAEKV